MSRGVLINCVNTYIGTALYEELLGENPAESPYEIYGTWHDRDDSFKPAFIKKMMKRSKPVLFRKYMREKMDCYIYDLHSGRLDDLKWAVKALTNEPLDSEKTLIVISSVLSWGGNEHKMIEVKPKKKKKVEEGEEGEGEEKKEGEEEEKEEEEEEKEENDEEKKEDEGEDKKEEEKKEEEEEKKEPKYDEEGNLIEEPEKKGPIYDEYGNEILTAELDAEGNEILPPSDEDFEYIFEDDYKARKEQEKIEAERLAKEQEAALLKEQGIEGEEKKEEEKKEGEEEKEEEKKGEEEKADEKKEEENNSEKADDSENEGEEVEKPERVYKRIIKVKKIKPKIYKRVGFAEKDYKNRVPIEFYEKVKEYEDYLLNLKFENLNIYIICAGIPYGGCETIFNYYFKSAWLQNPIELPYYGTGENLIPTIHIKDLSRIVKKLMEGKSESPYIFAIDKTKDKTLKNLISSMSINIGSGRTKSIEYNKDLIHNLQLTHDDFFIDPVKYEKNKLVMNITRHELQWTRFLGIDVMLKPSKFLDEEFEWYCKEGIPANSKKLLEEFCSYRKLRPLRIVMNCKNEEYRKLYAEKLSKFYNIPVLNFELMMEKLNQNIEELTEEEVFMNDKYFKLKDRIKFLDEHPDYKNEANELLFDKNEILFECLKYLLNSNAAMNRGYILEGIPVNTEEVQRLYYYKKEVKPEEGEEEEKPEEEEEEEEEEEKKDEEEKKEGDDANEEEKNEEEKKEDENNEEEKKEGDDANEEENEEEKKEDEVNEEEKKEGEEEKKEGEEADNNNEEEKKEGEPAEGEENEDGTKKKKKKKKVKKIKPKKYKVKFDKTLLPESVISLNQIDKESKEVENIFWEVEEFYQENNIEILNLVYEDEKKDDPEEIFELMRIYVERNGRPFNYFKLKDEDINSNRIKYVEEKQKSIEEKERQAKESAQKIESEKEAEYWKKMEERIENIKKDKEQLLQSEKVPTRKFLLINIMPTLTKGLLEVCKINPIDPIDYLADFLFNNSTNEK